MKRRWYHLHLATCASLMFLAVSFMQLNAFEFDVLLNILTIAVIAVGEGAFLESHLFSSGTLRFSLSTVFAVLAVAAITCGLSTSSTWGQGESSSLSVISVPDGEIMLGGRRPKMNWPFLVGVCFAIACTIYTALWLATRLAGWCFRFVSRWFNRPSGGERGLRNTCEQAQ